MGERLDEIQIPVVIDKEEAMSELKDVLAKLGKMDAGISIQLETDEATKEAIRDMKDMITEMQSVIHRGIENMNSSINDLDFAKIVKDAGKSLIDFQADIANLVKSSSQIHELVQNFDEFKKCVSDINELTSKMPNIPKNTDTAVSAKNVQKDVSQLEKKISALEKQKGILVNLQNSIANIDSTTSHYDKLTDYKSNATKLRSDIVSCTKALAEFERAGKTADNSFEFRSKQAELVKFKLELKSLVEAYNEFHQSKYGNKKLPEVLATETSYNVAQEEIKDTEKYINVINTQIDKCKAKLKELNSSDTTKVLSPVLKETISNNSVKAETAEIERITAKVNELSTAFNNKTKQIVLEEQQMRSSAAKEVKSLQAILDRVESIKSGLSEISNIDANIKVIDKKSTKTDETILSAKQREAEAKAIAAEAKALEAKAKAEEKVHRSQAQIVIDNERIAKAQLQAQAAAQKANTEATNYYDNYKNALQDYITNDKAFNIDPSNLINANAFNEAKVHIENLYSRLSNSAGMSKEEIKQLNAELQKQQSIIRNAVSESNKTTNSKGTYIGNIGTASSYKETEAELRKLITTTTNGTVIFQSFNEKNGQLKYAVREADQSLKQMNATLDRTTNSVRVAQVGTTEYTSTMGRAFQALRGKMGDLINYSLSAGVIYGAFNQLRNGIGVIKGIDDAMTELKKVTDETVETYREFPSVAASISKEIGSTSKEIINSAADWARLGFSISEATELAKNAAIYVNVGDGIDINTATSDMVSAMKAFNIEAKDSLQMVDKFNEVANNFAVSAGGIGEILKRSSSALAAAGNTIDQTIALGTAMQEVVQDTSVAGTTLKMLALRIRGAKVEIEQMGESTDGMAESTSKLRDQIKALTNVTGKGGFDIMSDDDTFKSTYEIIQGIARVWGQMNNIDQAALLELISGKNRAQGAAALLNNFSQAEKVLETSINSAGSAIEENEKYLDSIQGKLTLLSAKWQETWNHAISSDLLKYLIEIGTNLLDIVDKIGLLKVSMFAVFAVLSSKFSGKTIVLAHYGCESIAA